VTIRLLDPPLHEFLPQEDANQREMAQIMNVPVEVIKQKVSALHEFNPMLGHRGCRLGITYPEIYAMQVRAIIEAACNLKKKGVKVVPEIMIPLIGTRKELDILKQLSIDTINKVFGEKKTRVEYMIGTMIEVPRAALTADRVAETAEFFSFGTNDLTQMTLGFSRDDSGNFMGAYLEQGIFEKDVFQSIDEEGVGSLVKLAVEKGRKTKKDLKIGICGEHGGDPDSVGFCHRVGMNYVSCSPYRVPIARLAAAQAALKEKK
jgi:pyruvate,orthophosphate dikinase